MTPTISFQGYNSGTQTGVNNGTINAHFNLNSDPLDKLQIVRGAEFDSYENYGDECLEGTRTGLIEDIAEWAMSPQGKCIFWLNGMAGTGKSTISRTIAQRSKQRNLLGASFFFKRGEENRGNAAKLFPTLARQLASSIPQLMPRLQEALYNEPEITTKSLRHQFDNLILRPIQNLDHFDLLGPRVVVIDALDECERDDDVRTILRLLPQLRQLRSLSLRIFLTSRPELPIRLGFSQMGRHDYQDVALHQVSDAVTSHDISLFFNRRIFDIRENQKLPIDWPGPVKIQALVRLSVPLFIFAATVCRIFEDPQWDPIDSLEEILTHQHDTSHFKGTYLPVLNHILKGQSKRQENQLVDDFQKIIGAIVMLENPLSVNSLSKLMNLPQRHVSFRLRPLHSVLNIPEDEFLPVRLFHQSFRDFLLDPGLRDDTPLWIDEEVTQQSLTKYCIRIMWDGLRKNICKLLCDGTTRAEISLQTIRHFLPSEIQYSCRYWVHHLIQSQDLRLMMQEALVFLQRHLLHWIEAMSILGCISDAIEIINMLQTRAATSADSTMVEFLLDAKRFVLKNRQIADHAPLQIYSCGLIFAPKKSCTRRNFENELPIWIYQLPEVEEHWGADSLTLEGHLDSVQSVAFSSDSRLLLSGSSDETLRLWDSTNGNSIQTLEGHTNAIWSVAFSSDGQLVASGSIDCMIRLWNATTGFVYRIIDGHSDSVQAVAFSPNNQLLASGSSDKSIRLWDTKTGVLQKTLKGHADLVSAVAFSPASDSRLLASGSYDRTVRIWDVSTGALQHTLAGHQDLIWSVAISPNGELLVSGSSDKTIRCWDMGTGTLQRILNGHLDSVRSVSFSPDGQILASGSSDETIRLWSIQTGTLQRIFKGHSDSVRSVVFSPDGQALASGSCDKTVRLWDTAAITTQHQILTGHSDSIRSVVFSPDGGLLASGSYDQTVRLWKSETGVLHKILEGHSDAVRSVAFSPDGQLVASGSDDKTIRLWNTTTGTLQWTLQGHLGPVESIAFSLNGRLLASSSSDKTIRLWDTATCLLYQTLEGYAGWIQALEFSNDLRLLASGSHDKTIRLWDIETGILKQTLEGHSGWIKAIAFSPDGRLLASSSDDQTVRLWDTESGVLHKIFTLYGVVHNLKFSQDGLCLSTNLGFLDLQNGNDHCICHSHSNFLEINVQNRQWVCLNGDKCLRLPPEFRPSCLAVRGCMLALGHSSGRVSFLGFCTRDL